MEKPDTPFPKHWLYYIVLKYAVIAAAVKRLTPQPIKFVVNTHVHGDHTGGDENFGKMGATIISREELRYRLAHPNPNANGTPGLAACMAPAIRSTPPATVPDVQEKATTSIRPPGSSSAGAWVRSSTSRARFAITTGSRTPHG